MLLAFFHFFSRSCFRCSFILAELFFPRSCATFYDKCNRVVFFADFWRLHFSNVSFRVADVCSNINNSNSNNNINNSNNNNSLNIVLWQKMMEHCYKFKLLLSSFYTYLPSLSFNNDLK
jgi:hypothetical protein